jgi:hypothetical protein
MRELIEYNCLIRIKGCIFLLNAYFICNFAKHEISCFYFKNKNNNNKAIDMRNYFLFILFFFSLLFLSCGKDGEKSDSVIDEPNQQETGMTDHPTELVGTWVYYSGVPKSILSDVEGGEVLNHVLVFTPNGNFSESVTSISNNGIVPSSSVGNWKANKQVLSFTDWNGNTVNANISFSFDQDSVLILTYAGKNAHYYNSEFMPKLYPESIIGVWESYVSGSGRVRMVFNSGGTGVYNTYYINGMYYGREYITWKINNDSLAINYTDWAYPTSLHEYKINYLNINSLSLNYKEGTSYYSRTK